MSEERTNEVKDSEAGRASGPVQQLVAPAAERTGPETMPEGERRRCAGGGDEHDWITYAAGPHKISDRCHVCGAIRHRVPKPDSEASDNERSGRRNGGAEVPGGGKS